MRSARLCAAAAAQSAVQYWNHCWRGDESIEIYARVNDADWASWTQKMVNVAVDSTIASRLTYMDFSEQTRQRFTDIAEAMLSLNAGTARKATEAL